LRQNVECSKYVAELWIRETHVGLIQKTTKQVASTELTLWL
jgi:hypothetical protein